MRLVALVLALLSPALARAANSEEAKAHYEKGFAAYGLGHYAEAADEYEKAFSLKPEGALLYDAAQAHRLAGHAQRALELYQNYLHLFGEKLKNKDKAEVEKKIDELKQELAQAQPPNAATPATGAPSTGAPTTGAASGAPPTGVTAQAIAPPPPASIAPSSAIFTRAPGMRVQPSYAGKCPVKIWFAPTVYTRGPATIVYRTTRSDRSFTREQSFVAPAAGAHELPPVMWMVSGAPGFHTERWMQLQVTQPEAAASEGARVTVDCR